MPRPFRFLAPAAVLLVAALILPLAAHAAGYVSVRSSTVHVRAQPGTHAPIRWELDRGYPLRVMQKRGQWLQVADHEATLGWVYAPLTTPTAHRIVTAPKARLRAGPGTGQRILATLQRDEIVRTLATRGAWVQVQRASGQRGWIAMRLTWGW